MKILIVSPHPDDESLGAGGTLIKLKKSGHKIYWLNITDVKEEYGFSTEFIKKRSEHIKNIINFYKFDGFFNFQLQPAGLSNLDEGIIISKIRKVFDEVKPEWIIIPGNYDAHSDHRVVYNCCMACSKSFRSPYIRKILSMEIISETEFGFQNEKFIPNFFVDITEEFESKLNAIKIYDTEIEKFPFPRSFENIESLAIFRGGGICKYAEAFHIIKEILF